MATYTIEESERLRGFITKIAVKRKARKIILQKVTKVN